MKRGVAGIFGVIATSFLIALPGFRSTSGAGPTQAKQKIAEPKPFNNSELLPRAGSPKPNCKAPDNSYRAEMLQAVARQYSKSSVLEKATPNDECSADSINIYNDRDNTHVMMALLPDPVHTNLALQFDREIDALQQGAQDNGWIFSEAAMPWDNKDHPESSDPDVRKRAEIYQQRDQEQPGILIFRHAPNFDGSINSGRLLVFVVGETPTGGVRKEQFRNALDIVRQLFRDANGTQERPSGSYFILGPTFSGSLNSLSALLECPSSKAASDWACRGNATIVSGTVSDCSSVAAFDQGNTEHPVHTLQELDTNAIAHFLDFAEDRSYDLKHVAILSEDETAYGASVVSSPDKVSPCKGNGEKEVAHFYFPREISQLRNAYQHSLGAEPQGDKSQQHTTLPLDLTSSGSDDDTVRTYSRNQLPLSQESVLLGIVEGLRKHQSELVVIRATDPFDQLFLAQFLGQAYPQGRLITMESDLLFAREIQDARLRGVMALSTYDPSPGAEHEMAPSDRLHSDRVFPSALSIGTYNAMALLVAEIPSLTASRHDENEKQRCNPAACGSSAGVRLIGYHDTYNICKIPAPAIYLSVLGHEGFLHLATLPLAGSNSSAKVSSRNQIPKDWQLFWLLAVALSLAYAYFVWTASMFSTSESVAHLAPPFKDYRRGLFATTGYLHFALLSMVPFPYLVFGSFSFLNLFQLAVVVFTMVVIVVVCAADLNRREVQLRFIFVFVVACVATLAVLGWWWFASGADLSAMRCLKLSSGVSPLLPVVLLLLGGLWGSWYSLSGASLVGPRGPTLPSAAPRNEEEERIAKGLHPLLAESQAALRHYMNPSRVDPASVVAALLVLLGSATFFGFTPFRTLEGKGYELTLASLVAVMLSFQIAGAVRLNGMWARLRRLLQSLNLFHLASGFKALSGFCWAPLWRLGPGNGLILRKLVRQQVETADRIDTLHIEEFGDFEEKLDNPKKTILEVWRKAEQNSIQSISWRGDTLKRWLSKISEQGKLENQLLDSYSQLRTLLAEVTFRALVCVSKHSAGSPHETVDEESPEKSVARAIVPLQLLPATAEEKQAACTKEGSAERLRACEELIALLYTNFIIVVLIRIRTLIVSIGGMYIFLLLALSIYPFQPQLGIRFSLMMLLAGIVFVVGMVYAQMHRDTILSYITDTRPGELGADFWIQIITFVALPLLSLVASQFPEIRSGLTTWIEPALKALK
jgi:hypothetical protein